MKLPDFLVFLGLQADADERAIKRAYAVRLKKIDQETDPDGFQHLRSVYEAALDWARQGGMQGRAQGQATFAEEAVAQDMPNEVAPSSSSEQATGHEREPASAPQAVPPPGGNAPHEVFKDMLAALPDGLRTPQAARALLSHALDDERLVSLDARLVFEGLVIRLLLGGWRPGHEHLLEAAIDVFHWSTERGRFAPFGGMGAQLDAALQERTTFLSHPQGDQRAQWEVIAALRSNKVPGLPQVFEYARTAMQLQAWLPTLLPMITCTDNIKAWSQRMDKMLAPMDEASAPAALAGAGTTTSSADAGGAPPRPERRVPLGNPARIDPIFQPPPQRKSDSSLPAEPILRLAIVVLGIVVAAISAYLKNR